MPAFLTHRAAGERVFETFEKGVITHEKAFYLGCQGPDILFFRNYQPWRSAKNTLTLGAAMHTEKIRVLMTSALEYARQYSKKDKDDLASYIAGFITHYAIDKNAHPFVYGKAGKNANIHNAIEFMWDSFSAKEYWNVEPEQFDIYSEVMYGDIGDSVCNWYKSAAKDVYNRDITTNMVRQAQKHLAKAKKAISNIKLPVKVLMKIVSNIMGFDVRTMTYPTQRDTSLFSTDEYTSMQGMITQGVNEASDMIRFALDYINEEIPEQLPTWFGDTDFAGNPSTV